MKVIVECSSMSTVFFLSCVYTSFPNCFPPLSTRVHFVAFFFLPIAVFGRGFSLILSVMSFALFSSSLCFVCTSLSKSCLASSGSHCISYSSAFSARICSWNQTSVFAFFPSPCAISIIMHHVSSFRVLSPPGQFKILPTLVVVVYTCVCSFPLSFNVISKTSHAYPVSSLYHSRPEYCISCR